MRLHPYLRTCDTHSRVSKRGNTLVEYGVIGALGVVVVIVGMQVSGGNLNGLFNLFKKGMSDQAQVADAVVAQNASAKSSFSPASPSQLTVNAIPATLPPAALPPDALPLANATATGATATPTPTQTAGANGTTDYYAQTITDQAQQALAAGTINQTEYSLVTQLANKGHEIAQLQSYLESAMNTSQGDAAVFAAQTFNFNGQTYTADSLTPLITQANQDFQGIKQQAQIQVGIRTSDALLNTIENSGGNILINGGNASNIAATSYKATYFYQMQTADGQAMSSTATNGESAKICTSGQGSDSGTSCSP